MGSGVCIAFQVFAVILSATSNPYRWALKGSTVQLGVSLDLMVSTPASKKELNLSLVVDFAVSLRKRLMPCGSPIKLDQTRLLFHVYGLTGALTHLEQPRETPCGDVSA